MHVVLSINLNFEKNLKKNVHKMVLFILICQSGQREHLDKTIVCI